MKVIKAGDRAVVIALEGALTLSSENELFTLAETVFSGKASAIILDFSDVDTIDNTGLNLLVKFSVSSRKARQKPIASGLSKSFLEIFSMSSLDHAFKVFASTETALRATGVSGEPFLKETLDQLVKSDKTVLLEPEYWAPTTKKLSVPEMPPEAINLNVAGRRTAGPTRGFGQLWEKTYAIDLTDSKLDPEQIISTLKSRFPGFQPSHNRFYPTREGIKPGAVVLINASTPGGMVATGVMVLYAGPRSFTFITPEGHPEAGWVTFSSFQEDGRTMMQVQGLARASDPVYEAAFRIAGSNLQQQIWTYLLEALAKYTGSTSRAQFHKQCLDKSLQWTNCLNIFRNAQIVSILFSLTHPFRRSKHAV
ncbi:MAG: STAS domain-containing protein [Dehalococcoidia bacterium]|nr:STAS domain-containing protein [Dehalococcoidia bacterium]